MFGILSLNRFLVCSFISLAEIQSAESQERTPVDLTQAVVLTPAEQSQPEQNAVRMLVEEVEKRTLVRWKVVHEWPGDGETVIAVGRVSTLPAIAGPMAGDVQAVKPEGREGYVLRVAEGSPARVLATGNEARGVLYAVGRLLRELRMDRGHVQAHGTVHAPVLDVTSEPRAQVRGHQLGFRPKVHSYDAWTVPMWEQYYRDLIVFGINAVELMPPVTDDDADSPHFPLPQIEMMAEMSRLADAYDLDVWIWYPAMEEDYSKAETVEAELENWGNVFAQLPRIDVIFVPGGDPGHTQPKYLMPLLEKQTEVLHRTHPKAQMWMSPQSFTGEWTEEYLEIMKQEPAWLGGVVFGPQNRLGLPELRAAIPQRYPIRHYPDITHSYSSQYPVKDWDLAFGLTQDREVINPRPVDFAEIIRWSLPYTNGFITYSEGCNDDVNKAVWSALGWDPEQDVFTVLREYARYYIGHSYENSFAHALLALEQNWKGPLLSNGQVETTLQQVQQMDRDAGPQVRLNWRFQQVLYRAYFDGYIKKRLLYEQQLEEEAMAVLRKADRLGALTALQEAESILNRAVTEPVAQDIRGRVSDMAEALYQSIRMQLSVPRFQAIAIGRGAQFDLIDRPVNNKPWLQARFKEIRAIENEPDQMKAIDEIVNWTNPGPGGFYDDLGDPLRQPHQVREMTTEFDPENRTNPLLGYISRPVDRRTSWFNDAETRFEAPLKMQYENLDPAAQYVVRAVYAGDKFDTQMRLAADDIVVHDFVDKAQPIAPVEFEVPAEATADGSLTLTWTQTPGRGSAGRGCQVAEVWLIKK